MRSALLDLSLAAVPVTRPVIPGDHPDPTILRVGNEFWASSTSAEWSPQFPLFRSTDLLHWSTAGSIFPEQPRWAEGSFWAPELVEDRGRFLVYYVGKARGGPLSIAVATAARPGGPWTDRGPILAEPLGSIDPAFARDEHGAPFLIWKTDGNSQGQPTPIWAQPLAPDLLRLEGRPTQLITNDQPWEGGIVEGPYVFRHAHRFYLFYAGNACCGRSCQYAVGVARADHLLGPWTKSPSNPIVNANTAWRCPGHGTAVRGSAMYGKKGQDYLLYHAYPEQGTVYVGRQAVLDEITWGADGWPAINAGRGPQADAGRGAQAGRSGTGAEVNGPAADRGTGGAPGSEPVSFVDLFEDRRLNASWQWPVNTYPGIVTGMGTGARSSEGALRLRIPAGRQSAMLSVPIPGSPRYMATVRLDLGQPSGAIEEVGTEPEQPETPTHNPPQTSLWTGLAVVGDPFNTIGLGVRDGVLSVWQRSGSEQHVSWSMSLDLMGEPAAGRGRIERIWLRVVSDELSKLSFFSSLDGQGWSQAGDLVDGSRLPAWDRGLRIGLMLEGPAKAVGTFTHFAL